MLCIINFKGEHVSAKDMMDSPFRFVRGCPYTARTFFVVPANHDVDISDQRRTSGLPQAIRMSDTMRTKMQGVPAGQRFWTIRK